MPDPVTASGPPAPAGQVPFTITRQDHEPVYDSSGAPSSQWTIYFTTPSGIDSFVRVSDQDYSPANVYNAIAQRVVTIEQVNSLGQQA